jgi:hypothetical protein
MGLKPADNAKPGIIAQFNQLLEACDLSYADVHLNVGIEKNDSDVSPNDPLVTLRWSLVSKGSKKLASFEKFEEALGGPGLRNGNAPMDGIYNGQEKSLRAVNAVLTQALQAAGAKQAKNDAWVNRSGNTERGGTGSRSAST